MPSDVFYPEMERARWWGWRRTRPELTRLARQNAQPPEPALVGDIGGIIMYVPRQVSSFRLVCRGGKEKITISHSDPGPYFRGLFLAFFELYA